MTEQEALSGDSVSKGLHESSVIIAGAVIELTIARTRGNQADIKKNLAKIAISFARIKKETMPNTSYNDLLGVAFENEQLKADF